ncbi:MAG: hypothetical protein COV70_00750 [Parcubacteria group bacterium CG11_big_fil_rev_8_21_14_0_20_39_22]|nr:MAG: hypothetical protein COV70_00750 [Parcubacteria group bacterium CG11_big_fil_rev_8_21_14_0_20_39_22]
MVKKIFNLLNQETNDIHKAAYLLGFFAFLSQILALVRDRIFAGSFGAGETLDIYYAAFRIPDIILISAASIVSVSILIPFLVERLEKDKEKGRKFIDALFTVFFGSIVVVCIVVYFLIPSLVEIIFPGLAGGESGEQLILLSRIMMLQSILLGISNLFASVTQVYKKFFVYATSPILYNLGIIIGALFFYPKMGIAGLAWGVVLGAAFHMLVQVPVIVSKGLFPSLTLNICWRDVKEVMLISLPRTFALGINNISVLVLVSLASFMKAGSIAIFNLSWNLQTVPFFIIGSSYSIAAFPTLSRLFARGDMKGYGDQISQAIRHIVFWSFPALVLFIVLRAQIVRTILGFGEFSWSDTRLTAAALAVFSLSVVAQSLSALFIRAYYARGNTKKPLFINIFTGVVVVLGSYVLIKIFNEVLIFRYFIESLLRVSDVAGTEVLMLPLAYSIGLFVSIFLYWRHFARDFGRFGKNIFDTIYQSFAASVIMGAVTFVALNIFDNVFDIDTAIGIFLQGFCSGIVGIFSGVIILIALSNKEIKEVIRTLHKKFWKVKVVGPDSTEDSTVQK